MNMNKNFGIKSLTSCFIHFFRDLYLLYLNFVWGPLFVSMRPSFDHLKMFKTHRCGIHKVLRCFGKKPVKNTKIRVYLAK